MGRGRSIGGGEERRSCTLKETNLGCAYLPKKGKKRRRSRNSKLFSAGGKEQLFPAEERWPSGWPV